MSVGQAIHIGHVLEEGSEGAALLWNLAAVSIHQRQFERDQCRAGCGFLGLNVCIAVDHHTAVDGAVGHRAIFAGLGFELVENDGLGPVCAVGCQ